MYFRNDCYTGFTYNGVHSSTLGIYRVSESNRYKYTITPDSQDYVVDIPGSDLQIFFNSKFKTYEISISYAFDSLDEYMFHRLRQFYKARVAYPLILDENPYKVYTVTSKNNQIIKYNVFDEEGKRIYKGEGVLVFTVLSPFAESRFNYEESYSRANLEEWTDKVNDFTVRQKDLPNDPTLNSKIVYSDEGGDLITDEYYLNTPNTDEWIGASGIIPQGNYNTPYLEGARTKILLYNAGDMDAPLSLILKFNNNTIAPTTLLLQQNGNTIYSGTLTEVLKDSSQTILRAPSDSYIKINTRENMVVGLDQNYRDTGRTYIQYYLGDFIKVPPGESTLIFSRDMSNNTPYVEYKYLYF